MRFGAAAVVPSSLVLGLLLAPAFAQAAEVHHTVAKGHTIEAIANRYHVSVRSVLEANHLASAKSLQIGDVLTIPNAKEGDDAKKHDKADEKDKKGKKDDAKDKDKKDKKSEPTTYAAKAKTPGVVHVKRLATTEEADVRIADKRTKVSAAALKSFEKLMRSPSGAAHPIEPRLLAMLSTVSNHFGSRKIEIVSGFRPFTPTQYTPHSNHNHGKAIDFRVVGVPNEAVRDYCRTLKNTGCGYYPNSTFVHMDVREASAFWIDYAKPGEPPRYNAPNVEADEGTSDVHDDRAPAPVTTNSLPGEAKTEASPGASEPLPAPVQAPAPVSPDAPPGN